MAKKLQAIVIKSSDRKEKDKDILLFSIEEGKVWAMLRGVKNSNAKMKMAQSPFCFGEFVIENGRVGNIVTGFEIIESFYEISQDVDKYFEAIGILEIISALEFSSQAERAKIFVLVIKALKALCFTKVKKFYTLDKFLLSTFDIMGFGLDATKCSACSTTSFNKLYLNLLTGELLCVSCKNLTPIELSRIEVLGLKVLSQTDFDRLSTLTLAGESAKDLLKILVKNFEARFGQKLKLLGLFD